MEGAQAGALAAGAVSAAWVALGLLLGLDDELAELLDANGHRRPLRGVLVQQSSQRVV